MEGRRVRRFGRSRQHVATILPLRQTRLSNTVLCWYCDFKSTILNDPLFRIGRKYSKCLRIWFSVGTGFSLAALLGVVIIVLWELGRMFHLYNGNLRLGSVYSGTLFFFSVTSLSDVVYICVSSIVSVLIHEVGHALAAASEGIRMEYIAVFWAVVFPGALVAFNYELLQTISRVSALRIYCAGIWHNAATCFICASALFLLPVMLDPFYIYGDSPMVLNVSPTSPLSAYLSSRDLVVSLNGFRIHDVQEWKEAVALLNEHKHNDINGYCVPQSMATQMEGNRTSCRDELYAFSAIPCLDSFSDSYNKDDFHCFNPEDVIKLKRCGHTRVVCTCLEDESCFAPIQKPGLAWVEITYLSTTHRCPQAANDSLANNCSNSFVFVGDVIALDQAVQLTSYIPRWPNAFFSMDLPGVLEKLLICTFHVSLALALLNSLPVYFLDGECILELMMLQYLGFMATKTREKVLQWFLRLGSVISFIVVLRRFFLIL